MHGRNTLVFLRLQSFLALDRLRRLSRPSIAWVYLLGSTFALPAAVQEPSRRLSSPIRLFTLPGGRGEQPTPVNGAGAPGQGRVKVRGKRVRAVRALSISATALPATSSPSYGLRPLHRHPERERRIWGKGGAKPFGSRCLRATRPPRSFAHAQDDDGEKAVDRRLYRP